MGEQGEGKEGEEEEEEEEERIDTPNEDRPVCRFWRGQQHGWAITVVCLKNQDFSGRMVMPGK